MSPEDELELAVRRAREEGYALALRRVRHLLRNLSTMATEGAPAHRGWHSAFIWAEGAVDSVEKDQL